MENASEALKMAFGFVMFVLALTLSISSFSQATKAVDTIITLRDREEDYTYVEPITDSSGKIITERIVGIETVIPTMYKAYKENFRIVFYKADGSEFQLYWETDSFGNQTGKKVNYIDLTKEILPNATEAIEHLDILLNKRKGHNVKENKYYNQFKYTDRIVQ